MHADKKCPHCGMKIDVDEDYVLYHHEACGQDILVDDAADWKGTPELKTCVTRETFEDEYPNRDKHIPVLFDAEDLPFRTWVTVSHDERKLLFYHDDGNSNCYIAHIVDFDEVYKKEEEYSGPPYGDNNLPHG